MIELHDVPEDRPAADLHHGLGLDMGFLGEPRTEPTREDHRLHDFPSRARTIPSKKRCPVTLTATGPSNPIPRTRPTGERQERQARTGAENDRIEELMDGRKYPCGV